MYILNLPKVHSGKSFISVAKTCAYLSSKFLSLDCCFLRQCVGVDFILPFWWCYRFGLRHVRCWVIWLVLFAWLFGQRGYIVSSTREILASHLFLRTETLDSVKLQTATYKLCPCALVTVLGTMMRTYCQSVVQSCNICRFECVFSCLHELAKAWLYEAWVWYFAQHLPCKQKIDDDDMSGKVTVLSKKEMVAFEQFISACIFVSSRAPNKKPLYKLRTTMTSMSVERPLTVSFTVAVPKTSGALPSAWNRVKFVCCNWSVFMPTESKVLRSMTLLAAPVSTITFLRLLLISTKIQFFVGSEVRLASFAVFAVLAISVFSVCVELLNLRISLCVFLSKFWRGNWQL